MASGWLHSARLAWPSVQRAVPDVASAAGCLRSGRQLGVVVVQQRAGRHSKVLQQTVQIVEIILKIIIRIAVLQTLQPAIQQAIQLANSPAGYRDLGVFIIPLIRSQALNKTRQALQLVQSKQT